ncbi:MAG: hypothetical protein ACTS2F_22035 [Thainema sp.]
MLKKLINQFREQLRLIRMQRRIQKVELERVRERHHRRHSKGSDSDPNSNSHD